MSFTAIGTPARMCRSSPAARRRSMSRAVASAPLASTCRNAWTEPSTAAMRSRWAWVASTALISLRYKRSASSAALARVMSEVTFEPLLGGLELLEVPEMLGNDVGVGGRPETSVLVQDPRDGESLLLGGGRTRQRLLGGQAGPHDVGPRHVGQRQRVRRRWDVVRGHLVHAGDGLENDGELAGHLVELSVTEIDAREHGEMGDIVAGDCGHAPKSSGRSRAGSECLQRAQPPNTRPRHPVH